MTNYETQAITHSPSTTWATRTELIECWLKDGERTRTVQVTVDESDNSILELKSINAFGEPRENFDSLITDIREFFRVGHSDCKYTDFRGLFQHAIQ